MDTPVDPFAVHHQALRQIHAALVVGVRGLVEPTGPDLVPRALGVCRFLLGHHQAEDDVLFPALRRSSRLRSADVSFLDGCDRQHRELHALCDRLAAAAARSHPDSEGIRTLARELEGSLAVHLRDEEAGLAPDRMRWMIDVEGLECIGREVDALRRRRAGAVEG